MAENMHAAVDTKQNPPVKTWRHRVARLIQQKPVILVELVLATIALYTIGTLGLVVIALLSLGLRGTIGKLIGGIRLKDWSLGFGFGLLKIALYPFVLLLVARGTGLQFDTTSFDSLRGDVGLFLKLIPVLWIFSAAVEEVGFRSYLLNRVTSLFNDSRQGLVGGVVITSVMFGFAHWDQGWFGVIETSIAGLIYAGIYLGTKRVWATVIVHAVFDTVVIGALVFSLDVPIRHVLGL